LIPAFMAASSRRPEAMVLGRPVFDASAPLLRVRGRQISNGLARLETLGAGIDDALYGFRVYPIAPLVAVMRGRPGCAASTSTPRRWFVCLARRPADQHRRAGQVPARRRRRRLALSLRPRQRAADLDEPALAARFRAAPAVAAAAAGAAPAAVRHAVGRRSGGDQIIAPLIETIWPLM
jgi:hypothetical protein